MADVPISFNLSEELAMLMFSSSEENGLTLIKSLPGVSVRARGNVISVLGSDDKIKIIKQFFKILNARIGKREELEYADIRRVFKQLSNLNFFQIL